MQCENGLLRLTLNRHRLDARLLRRRPDRARIGHIVLVAADKRLHPARGEQPYFVTELVQFARPML
jgi:hypothetical protein